MATGILYLNNRDVDTDFSLAISEFGSWPGGLSMAPRLVPLLEGPEMPGAEVDPRTVRRRPATPTIRGIIKTASVAAAMTAIDALRDVVSQGEVMVRSAFATDRECSALCTDFVGDQEGRGLVDGNVAVALTFTVRDGTARRLAPDGYALTTGRTSCPIGTAESRPILVVHGGGASLTNPTITVRNAAGDSVQTMAFTLALGATAALRVDCTRMSASVVTAGVVTDALALGYWTSGDFPVLRAYDALLSAGAYPTVALSASAGTPVGDISYRRRYL